MKKAQRPLSESVNFFAPTPHLPISQALVQLRPGGLVVASDTFFATHSEQLAALTVRHAVPAIRPGRGKREAEEEWGLRSHCPVAQQEDAFRT